MQCSGSDHTLTYRSMAQRSSEELLADWSSELEAVLYDPEVEEAIREVSEGNEPCHTRLPHPSSLPHYPQVCPSSDPLDSKDFNHIDYINQLFPTEQVRLVHSVSW